MQRKNSVLLSHSGLRYLNKTDRNMFEFIKRKFLSEKWINSDFDTQIKEIAHNIRNTYYSCNKLQVKIPDSRQLSLF
jgi:hypothetical protein